MELLFPADKTESYYRRHRYTEIPFDSGAKYALGLIERDIYLLRGKTRWYCRIHAAGMSGAKVLVSLSPEEAAELERAREISLNFSFIGIHSYLIPISLSIPYTVESVDQRRTGEEGYLLSLSNKHKPPDYLIGIFGDHIESTRKGSNRKEERIVINDNSRSALRLTSKRARFDTGGERLSCTVDDLSLSGAGITLFQSPGSDPNTGTLVLVFRDPDTIIRIPSSIVRYAPRSSRKNAFTAGLEFDETPPEFKYRMVQALGKE